MVDSVHYFGGCKLALFYGDSLVVYRRDNISEIPFPGMLDFPGGGREGDESPEQCVLRKLLEEFSLKLPAERLTYRRQVAPQVSKAPSFFFAAELMEEEIKNVSFGDEGQYWQLMKVSEYLKHPDGIKGLKERLQAYLVSGRNKCAANKSLHGTI